MYVVAIGWLYVVTLMAFAEPNVVAGVLTFVFYGLLPLSLLMWLFGGPGRRRLKAYQEDEAADVDSGSPSTDKVAEAREVCDESDLPSRHREGS